MAARSVWAAREDGEVWVHTGGVERINVTRLQAQVERLREALRDVAMTAHELGPDGRLAKARRALGEDTNA